MSEIGKEIVTTATELAKVLPVKEAYEDLLQPAARELGQGLMTIAQTVNILLAPLKIMVMSYDLIMETVSSSLTEKLKRVPPERLITPSPIIAGPTLEALRFTGHEEDLRELFVNLLASSMDSHTAPTAHPGFVEIIKQITPDEAKVINYIARCLSKGLPIPIVHIKAQSPSGAYHYVEKNVTTCGIDAGCVHADLIGSYLDNLSRLGLINLLDTVYARKGAYDKIYHHPDYRELISSIEDAYADREPPPKILAQEASLELSSFGHLFINACLSREE